MKTLGILSLALAVICGVIAATSMHYAMGAAMLGLAFALVGIGFLDAATDPRRKPNPRTNALMLGVADERIEAGDRVEVLPGLGRVRRHRG